MKITTIAEFPLAARCKNEVDSAPLCDPAKLSRRGVVRALGGGFIFSLIAPSIFARSAHAQLYDQRFLQGLLIQQMRLLQLQYAILEAIQFNLWLVNQSYEPRVDRFVTSVSDAHGITEAEQESKDVYVKPMGVTVANVTEGPAPTSPGKKSLNVSTSLNSQRTHFMVA